ncbi:uncharacterized protein TRIADDRAFT_34270, partial [Trichoplax adhaerens]
DIEDIDRADFDNPQLVAEYINEIYHHMRQKISATLSTFNDLNFSNLQITYRINDKFLAGQQINEKMRTILIDWLIQVHLRFHLLQETLYLTVNIIDRFLQVS